MADVKGSEGGRSSVAEDALLSRWRFLDLCIVGIAGLLLLGLAGCGGGEDRENGGGGDDNGEDDNEDDGGGGGGGY